MNIAGVFNHSRSTFDTLMAIGERVWINGQQAGPNIRYMPVVLPDDGVIWVGAQRFSSTGNVLSSVFPFWDNTNTKQGMEDYEKNL